MAVPPVRVRLLLQLVGEYNKKSGRLSDLLRGLAPLVAQVDGVRNILPLAKEAAKYVAPGGKRELDKLIRSVERQGIDPVAAIDRGYARCRVILAAIARLAGQLLERAEVPPAADPPVRTIWGAALAQQHKGSPLEPLTLDLPAVETALFAAYTPTIAATTQRVRADGPYGGCWCVVKGVRHNVPNGVLYRLLELFWTRDHATYDELYEEVFLSRVDAQTVRARASALSKVLRRIGVKWRLSANLDLSQPGGGYLTRHTPDA